MASSFGKLQHVGDGLREARPTLLFGGELFAAGSREVIITGAAIILRNAPLGGDPALLFHTMKRRVERAFFDTKDVIRNPLNVKSNPVAVHGSARERLEDKKSKSPLQDVGVGLGQRAPIDSYR